MSIRVPLSTRTSGGALCDRALVMLRVLTQFGDYAPLSFALDTGAEFSSIPINKALENHIRFDRSRPGMVGGLLGRTQRYRGSMHVLIAGRTHVWPCHFLQTPVDVGEDAMPVLGRAVFREDYDFCMDDEFVTLTRRSWCRRWWRRIAGSLSRPFVTCREADDPL